ncbi:H(+)-transporting V0 sector ATPase subunit a KNAG_0M02640 [Huiozyma naganishii CBS 8797]|uniref:V-type proton ATPase subunit a n=1 Tax=Huiozyma naganishii (strain ATCC MYA-139 / BCRC 22969 / CBS 8797 / KCTC 17520 / NBRC 10181 / NCYC 3082 / Yp74L-3) TaxID=1071383 RepID=J7S4B7_HUIN7|nr:hypothetical protein KNAG_0M02640 [Kazachstania naganishii CBS 8797]CCK73117.1 hypothetical protein KNAG_0M02640 [Kazachstania naganishii CBS 8797]
MVKEEAIYRSAAMTYVQLYIPRETSREVVCLLGNLGLLMVRDLNSDVTEFQRGYVNQLRKLEVMMRSLQYLRETMDQHSEVNNWHLNDGTYTQNDVLIRNLETHSLDSINEILGDIDIVENRVKQLDHSLKDLQVRLNGLIETRYVMFKCSRFMEVNPGFVGRISRDYTEQHGLDADDFSFDNLGQASDHLSEEFSFDDPTTEPDSNSLRNENPTIPHHEHAEFDLLEQGLHNQFMTVGSIRRDKVDVLNRILFRLLRGNIYFQNFPIEQPLLENNELVEKDCFLIFTHGETLLTKVKKVVESLNGVVVPLDKNQSEFLKTLNDQISDLEQVSMTTEQALHTELLVVNDQFSMWDAIVKREKAIYSTLNLFRAEAQGLVAEGWIPTSDLLDFSTSLKDFMEVLGSESSAVVTVIHTNKSPPTFHRTNKFTSAFQSIVDAYGIATYQEINPGLATIVTFPFMFAIMFGDAGHGFILFAVALYMILRERTFDRMKRDEIFDMAYTGRYVLVLMGAFSIYTGILYNDIFSKSMNLFKSGWEWPSGFKAGESIEAQKTSVYPLGLDFAWHGTENGLIFSNSYKMKLSILMGFAHMTYSLMFSYVNYRNKRSMVEIIGNFIPSLLFMQSIFGYLSWAIIFKWSKDWNKDGKPAPGLLNMLINMFLAPGKIDYELYPHQALLQKFLLLVALISVPWLLLYKPLVLRRMNNKATGRGYQSIHEQQASEALLDTQRDSTDMEGTMVITDFENSENGESTEFNFGDVMIHQVIHTIEFCLNCISHTASYLRLWALSLAHAQLSTVLWAMTIQNAFSSSNPGSPLAVAKVVFLFGMWFILTVCILVCMEGTSAMLHALRLHWVEAMSKYFEGEGYAYEPFAFKTLAEGGE